MDIKKIKMKPGRASKFDIKRLQTISWFNTVAKSLDCYAPNQLEKILQPELVKKDSFGKDQYSRSWSKYKNGKIGPSDGVKASGRLSAVEAAGKVSQESKVIFRHPIWKIMRQDKLEFKYVIDLLNSFDPYVRRYYIDLKCIDKHDIYDSFAKSVGLKIWVDRDDDMIRSLDHLSIHLMMLKMDIFSYDKNALIGIAENIVKTLGPISVSPWTGPIYQEMYDWLENNIWKDLFDMYYFEGSSSIKGWRRTQGQWISPNYRL